MYNDEDISDETESESSDKDFVLSTKRKKTKNNKGDGLTWAEAAEIVLEQFDHPLPPKEVFKLIKEAELKTDVNSSAPVAVLNSILNNQSKGARPIFYKCPTGASSYGLIKTRRKSLARTTGKPQPITKVDKNFTDFKKEQSMKQKLTPPTAVRTAAQSLKPPGQKYPAPNLRVKKPLIPPGEKAPVISRYTPPLGSLSKAAYLERLKQQPQHRRMMGPTTSALVRPAPPFSRPPPGAALRVMPPKKRIKIDQDENDSDSSCQSKKSDDIKDEVPKRPSRVVNSDVKKDMGKNIVKPPTKNIAPCKTSQQRNSPQGLKNNINHRSLAKTNKSAVHRLTPSPTSRAATSKLLQMKKSPSNSSLSHIKRNTSTSSIMSTTSEPAKDDSKQPFFVGVKFKKLKKGFQTNKDNRTELMTPDSVLSSLQLKDIFDVSTFKLLPPAYQYQLLMLLPECDRITGNDGSLRLSPHSLNNGFFSRACQEYKDKLLDGDLNSDIITRAKQEVRTNAKLDPWKAKYFEPVYGKSSLDDVDGGKDEKPPENIKPIQSSWVPFLKFAENSTSDYEDALAKIQEKTKKFAEKEAKEKEEAEQQRKEEVLLRNKLINHKSSKTLHSTHSPLRHQLSNRQSHLRPSPTSRPSVSRGIIDSSKEKSKRALKRAQMLQRKKIFEKQLKDAKAKIVEEARSSVRKDDDSRTNSNSLENCKQTENIIKNDSNNVNLKQETVNNPSVRSNSTEISNSKTENSTTVLDLTNGATLKKLLAESEANSQTSVNTALTKKTITTTNPKRRTSDSKHPASRVVHGAASFGTNSNGVCPCNVKAMFLCKQCGSAWHGDCVNSDKICISCS